LVPAAAPSFDAGDVPGAVGLLSSLGAAGAHVRAGVGLGEHHGGAPLLADHVPRQLLLLVGAQDVQHLGEGEPGGVHVHGGVRSQDELGDGPAQRRGDDGAAELTWDVEAPPLGIDIGLVGLGERGGERDRAGRGVEHRRVAIGVEQALGKLVLREATDLAEDLAGSCRVDVGVRTAAQDLLTVEDLEQVELEIAQVALVVAHQGPPCSARGRWPTNGDRLLPVSNINDATDR